jgi:hypothetical protein
MIGYEEALYMKEQVESDIARWANLDNVYIFKRDNKVCWVKIVNRFWSEKLNERP